MRYQACFAPAHSFQTHNSLRIFIGIGLPWPESRPLHAFDRGCMDSLSAGSDRTTLFQWRRRVKTLNSILRFIDNLNDWIGKILSYGSFLMFILVLSEVVRRYFFNSPTVWANELTQLIFGAYVILSGGYILRWGGHVNVDIFYSTLSDRWKAVLDIATAIVFFLFCSMLFVYGENWPGSP